MIQYLILAALILSLYLHLPVEWRNPLARLYIGHGRVWWVTEGSRAEGCYSSRSICGVRPWESCEDTRLRRNRTELEAARLHSLAWYAERHRMPPLESIKTEAERVAALAALHVNDRVRLVPAYLKPIRA